jgi:hypothetical protein
MDDKKIAFVPFNALDRFMRPDYRLNVIRTTLHELPGLPQNYRAAIDRATKKTVKVPGFRNSEKAPTAVKVIPMANAFEKSPDLVASVISAWVESHPELKLQVYDLLIQRHWEILPIEADRTKLPGFLPYWPKGEEFEVLYQAYIEMYPQADTSMDNVSLMVVWLSGRLPFQEEETETDDTLTDKTVEDDQHPM